MGASSISLVGGTKASMKQMKEGKQLLNVPSGVNSNYMTASIQKLLMNSNAKGKNENMESAFGMGIETSTRNYQSGTLLYAAKQRSS